mgnify:CR=1 FL=1
MEDDEKKSTNYDAANNEIEKQFVVATGGLRMPPAPKSKVAPKFDFDDISSENGSAKEEVAKPAAAKGGFDFGLMSDEEEEEQIEFKLP